jgi:DNA-binding transcriptional LysR family regulator
MTNIPTDLLRTFVSVVELRSFTKAAQSMGVTQPAVSAQIKRLQFLLGSELLDKSAPGVSLTPTGELVLNYALRLLSINDQILNLAGPASKVQIVRIGMSGDCYEQRLANALAQIKNRWHDVRFDLQTDRGGALMSDLRNGELELAVALSVTDPTPEAYTCWTEELTWMRSDATKIDPDRPVPLVAFGEHSAGYRVAVAALNEAGRRHELVFTASSIRGLASAVSAGIGVMVLASHREVSSIYPWEDAPLPRLPKVYRGIYVREGGDRAMLEQLANAIAAALRPQPAAGAQIAAAS